MGRNCPVGEGNKVLTMVFRQRVISFHLHETSFTVSVPLQKLICSEPVFPMSFRGQEGCQILCHRILGMMVLGGSISTDLGLWIFSLISTKYGMSSKLAPQREAGSLHSLLYMDLQAQDFCIAPHSWMNFTFESERIDI